MPEESVSCLFLFLSNFKSKKSKFFCSTWVDSFLKRNFKLLECEFCTKQPWQCLYMPVNLCLKLLFLHQLTHNMTTDCSLNYENCKLRTCSEHVVVIVLTFRTIYEHNMFWACSELAIFMYWNCNSMNNLLSYCGIVDARISAS